MIRRPKSEESNKYFGKLIPLKIELIPKTSWYNNVRKADPFAWNKIKKIAKAKFTSCEICGRKFGAGYWNQRDVHESFTYDVATKIQTLDSLVILCHACHMAKHPGYMMSDQTAEGRRKYNYVIGHSCKVNGITKEEFDFMLREEMSIWTDRSKITWEVDLSKAYVYIEENKEQS